MSSDASAFTKETSEQDVEVLQEEPIVGEPQPAVEAEVDVEKVQENVAEPENADSTAADASDLTTGDDVKPQASRPVESATAGTGLEDSQESSISLGGSTTESQLSGATRCLSRELSHESSASVGDSGTESQQGCGNTTNLKLLGVIGGPSRRPSPIGAEADSSSASGSYKTALAGDSSSRGSLKSGATGEVSNSSVSPGSSVKGTGSWEGTAAPAPPLSASGEGSQPRRRSRELIQNADGETQEEVGRNYEQCLRGCAFACDLLKPCVRRIRNSKIYIFLIRPILLLLAISAISMGVAYRNDCPKKSALPIFFILIGVSGIFLLIFNFASHFRPSLCPNVNGWFFKGGVVTLSLIFIWMFADVLMLTYLSPPSFDPSDVKNYCHMVFYYYAYYINIVIVGIIVLELFLYIPTMNSSTQGYEQF